MACPVPRPCFVSVTQRMKLISESLQGISVLTERLGQGDFISPHEHLRLNTCKGVGTQLSVGDWLDAIVGTKRNTRVFYTSRFGAFKERNVFSYFSRTRSHSWLSFTFLFSPFLLV